MSDMKFWDVFRDPLWLLRNLHDKYKVLRVPTNAGWATSNVNGGVTQEPMRIYANTSVTASSRGLANTTVFGMNSSATNDDRIDWREHLELSFILVRHFSDAEAVARIQLKEAATEGVLGAEGIGVQISNLTMVGEAYGTALGTTGTLKILGTHVPIYVKIVKTNTSVDFYVNGVLVESLTGTAVPAALSANVGFLVISIINGVTGGVDVSLFVSNIEMVQAW